MLYKKTSFTFVKLVNKLIPAGIIFIYMIGLLLRLNLFHAALIMSAKF